MGKTSWFWFKLVVAVLVVSMFSSGLVLAQTSSQEIYIYVTLRQPECGAPPDTIEISGASCDEPIFVEIKANRNPGTNEWFNVYRHIKPLLWVASLAEDLKVGITFSRTYRDEFADGAWIPYGSKGVCDCDINYFWVMTTGDTLATGDTCESAYPSNCVGEFDFCLESTVGLSHMNHIVYTLVRSDIEAAGNTGASLAGTIGGSTILKSWDAPSQNWTTVAYWTTAPPFPRWVNLGNVELLYPYVIDGGELDPIWSMQIPGLVPTDPHFDLVHNTTLSSWNFISLPFYEQQIAEIETGCDLFNDITDCEFIKRFDGASQNWATVAYWTTAPPFPRCVNLESVRAGYPYYVSVASSSTWPYEVTR
ncbi:hypothetical protein JXI42_02825 [bacterium]|nr:hypothetical protein [bacterium]